VVSVAPTIWAQPLIHESTFEVTKEIPLEGSSKISNISNNDQSEAIDDG
jgi:hypothetical protein